VTGPEITHFHCQSGWRELTIRLYSPGVTALGTRSAGLLRSSYQLSQAQSLLSERRGALRATSIQLAADRSKLIAQLVTRQTVAADEAAYEAARGQLQVALESRFLAFETATDLDGRIRFRSQTFPNEMLFQTASDVPPKASNAGTRSSPRASFSN
jgi:hypothetical protein